MDEYRSEEEEALHIKTTDPVLVLSAERTITLPDVATVSAKLCPAIAQDAESNGLTINGPWIFVSHGLPSDMSTAFKIQFCLPVSARGSYQGEFMLKTLEPITCATAQHEGPLNTLFSDGYGPLVRAITEAGRTFSGESREVYHRWQGPDATDNRIEIQFGLK